MESTTGLSSFLIDTALALITVVGTLVLLSYWFAWLAKTATRDVDGPDRDDEPVLGANAWGEPDLSAPSTSVSARAETAELEALWQLPPRRADSGHT
jgi:hypothetical protein